MNYTRAIGAAIFTWFWSMTIIFHLSLQDDISEDLGGVMGDADNKSDGEKMHEVFSILGSACLIPALGAFLLSL